MREVVVVTGAGGMGECIARRISAGRVVVLADFDEAQLAATAGRLRALGHEVREHRTDVSSHDEVVALARFSGGEGAIRSVVHTAGVSPVQATSARIVAVDVVGTALVLDAFEPFVGPGTVAVCIASMAGAMATVDADTMRLFATTPTEKLHALAALDPAAMDPGTAYAIAKRANLARVEAASLAWGRRGGRVVSVSPGVISTPMGAAELDGPSGEVMRMLVEMSGTRRLGTPDDIAAAAEFLVSPAASFITGTDLLVDGGVVAAVRMAGGPRS
jgi:NAD(P)-dependent dehydrogenase (short-subunit alcohol dehydrogenase family)